MDMKVNIVYFKSWALLFHEGIRWKYLKINTDLVSASYYVKFRILTLFWNSEYGKSKVTVPENKSTITVLFSKVGNTNSTQGI